jgi:hypothetical protein
MGLALQGRPRSVQKHERRRRVAGNDLSDLGGLALAPWPRRVLDLAVAPVRTFAVGAADRGAGRWIVSVAASAWVPRRR